MADTPEFRTRRYPKADRGNVGVGFILRPFVVASTS